MLETMALIAYRQPITRGEIEDVRGVRLVGASTAGEVVVMSHSVAVASAARNPPSD